MINIVWNIRNHCLNCVFGVVGLAAVRLGAALRLLKYGSVLFVILAKYDADGLRKVFKDGYLSIEKDQKHSGVLTQWNKHSMFHFLHSSLARWDCRTEVTGTRTGVYSWCQCSKSIVMNILFIQQNSLLCLQKKVFLWLFSYNPFGIWIYNFVPQVKRISSLKINLFICILKNCT